MEQQNVPKLRFPGFTDVWEQRKLAALCEYITVGIANSATHAYRENGVVMFRNQNIKENYLDDSDIIHIDEEFEKKYINKRLKANDLLIARTGYPGTACVVPEKYEGSQTFTTLIARLKDGINPFYACQYINSDYGKKYILATQIGGGQKNSGAGILEELPMMLPPTIEEQNIIAEFFTNLDNTITLHQRKCDETIKLKKGMLQKMFPKEGESEPEIRFSGFVGPWEYCKLGDLYTERNERGSDDLQILSVSIHSGISEGELEEKDLGKHVRRSEDKTKYKRVYEGDVIFNMMRAWQGAIGVAKCNGMVSPAYISAIPNEKVYPLFMDYCLRRDETIAEINNLSYGVTDFRKRLYWDSFVNVTCQLPSVKEQEKVYGYFKSLESYIALHQKKANELKKMKKALLQQMFV